MQTMKKTNSSLKQKRKIYKDMEIWQHLDSRELEI
jgi:hypothetical protein